MLVQPSGQTPTCAPSAQCKGRYFQLQRDALVARPGESNCYLVPNILKITRPVQQIGWYGDRFPGSPETNYLETMRPKRLERV